MTDTLETRTITPMSPNTTLANTDITPASPSPSLKRKADDDGATRRKSESPSKKVSKLTPEEQEAARLKKLEQEEKKAARLEKKLEQEKEKERKEALLKKQKNAMASFFKKPPTSSTTGRASPAGPSTLPAREPSPEKESDYRRTFKGIVQRSNTKWAPINRFTAARAESTAETVSTSNSIGDWRPPQFISEHLSKHQHKASSTRRFQAGFKTAPPHASVAELFEQLPDAEDPRAVLAKLRNKERYPWKTLAFDQQTRPPYRGTWTKRSVAVGPRTPFAQDPIFDYSYDSGDDWDDDDGGEDVDNFGEANAEPEDEEEEDESEGEFDDWLDDTEDADQRAGTPMDLDGDPAAMPGSGNEQSKLPMKVIKKSQVAKRVVPLKPRADGPLWEVEIGKGNEGFEGYRLQLLNETPDSIDPFAYVSADAAQAFKTTFSTTVIGTSLSVKTLLAAQPVAPPKPVPTQSVPPAALPTISESNGTTITAETGKPGKAGLKSSFPASHLEELLRLIDGNTKIRTDLISQLRAQFETVATKAAIEAKVKEVAVRNGKAKDSKWEVKPAAWLAAGVSTAPKESTVLTPPVSALPVMAPIAPINSS